MDRPKLAFSGVFFQANSTIKILSSRKGSVKLEGTTAFLRSDHQHKPNKEPEDAVTE